MDPQICKERILSEEYMDIIITQNRMGNLANLSEETLCRQNLGVFYESIHIPMYIGDMTSFSYYAYSMIPTCYTLIDTEAISDAGITNIQNHPTLRLMGQNVMIGLIDTGIDYTNPIFRNLDGSTRIEAIWDQTVQSGTSPDGFVYGSEYTRDLINVALNSDDPEDFVPSRDDDGHGTYMASLAAGGASVENQFIGAAPEATIAMVKLKSAKEYLRKYYLINSAARCYQENDIMAGLRYLHELATQRGLPLVICLALGTNQGNHNGASPLCGLLESYANFSNRVIVTGSGNEANERHHFSDQFTSLTDVKTVEIVVEEGVNGFVAELWTEVPNLVSVSVRSPSGEVIPVGSVRDRESIEYNFVFDRTKLILDYRLLVEKTSSELIFFRFENANPGTWTITVHPLNIADGIFHMWLPVKEFLTGNVYFTNSNPDVTLTEPSNTYSPITVGYFDSTTQSVTQSSGRGYTRLNRIKPDFVAPGVNVIGALPGNRFEPRTGACAGIAITVGAAALMMEWAVYISEANDVDSLQVKNYLILGAQQDPVFAYPNKVWGYGRLDLYNTFLRLREY